MIGFPGEEPYMVRNSQASNLSGEKTRVVACNFFVPVGPEALPPQVETPAPKFGEQFHQP
jgi:hypothetical protein